MSDIKIKKYSSSVFTVYVFILGTIILLALSVLKNKVGLSLLLLLPLIFLIVHLYRIRRIFISQNKIYQLKYWSDDEIWGCLFDDIKKVEIIFFSDTIYRSKQIKFVLNNNTEHNVILVSFLLADLVLIFKEKNIPVYVRKNEKLINY